MKPQKRRKKKGSRPRKPVGKEEGCEQEDENRRDAGALMEAFGSVSVVEAASAYREAEEDLNKAAEILGRLVLESSDDQTATSSEGFVEANCGEDLVNEKGFKGGKKKKRVVAATGTVSTVLGKDYAVSKPPRRDLMKAKPVNKEEAEQFLCSMFGDECELSMAVVRDVLCQCGYNFDKLTDGASDSTSHSSESELQDNARPLDHYFRNYAEVLASSETCSPSSPRISQLDPAQQVLEYLFNIPKSSEQEPSTMNWRNVAKKMESLGQGFDFHRSGVVEPQPNSYAKGDEYQVYRKAANQQWDSVKSCYQKAATAYSKGELTYAAYLSDQGKVQTKVAREADEKASQNIFEARNKSIKNVITIDLHGQHVKQAIRLLKIHLLFGVYVPSVKSLRVITGCGSHGVGKSKLKQSVINLMEKEGIEWSEENRGTVIIKLDGQRDFRFLESDGETE
ncbi:SMR domain-containing protein At5g58720 isoform X2 [Vitis vinifera]|uniref:SMR domain-containing protein At5g58720 isoform X2 n=1 Tax=Vitis vinifera TaxID=29760 RepID=UPI000198366E|nr:SMR domain-containing protein At5g58720 isoform X2 [Vitis vinifera]|eukprot:XP_010650902.1 PREDICTED: SMR domain-containing protein At5g58720 isoform X2 [Vitis vinifera]